MWRLHPTAFAVRPDLWYFVRAPRGPTPFLFVALLHHARPPHSNYHYGQVERSPITLYALHKSSPSRGALLPLAVLDVYCLTNLEFVTSNSVARPRIAC